MLRLFDLSNAHAFLSGAAGHLGRPMAFALAEAGAHVWLNGRDARKLGALAEEIAARGGRATPAPFDVSDAAARARFFSNLEQLDILVNNAFSGRGGVLGTHTDDDYQDSYRTIVTAAASFVDLATPLLTESARAHGTSAVINVASMYGMVSPDPRIYGDSGANNPAYYGAAKAALLQYTRYAAAHLGPQGVRVNAISPGPFPPPSVRESNPAFHAALCAKTPLGRIGAAEELAGAVVFLASPSASYVTGVNLPVDGGWTAW